MGILPKEFVIEFERIVQREYAKKKNEIASANIEMLLNYLSHDEYMIAMETIINDDYDIISRRHYSFPVIALVMLGLGDKNKWRPHVKAVYS